MRHTRPEVITRTRREFARLDFDGHSAAHRVKDIEAALPGAARRRTRATVMRGTTNQR
jgi:hypothetical protein